jgi:ATP adenylyltransferase
LPYEPELFVANMGEEHVLLLNKFNVFADHLLLVTRDFVEQETLLNEADFSAIARLMAEEDGLAFFNSGPIAGASQRHKHLQFVPLPLGPRDVPALPMLSLLRQGQLGFRYAFESLTLDWAAPSIGQALLERYRAQLSSLKLTTREASQGPEPEPPSPAFDSAQRPLPYNLLLGRDWMAVVPRCRESAGGLSLNALAYVGSFFTNQPLSLEQMRQRGALQLLGECGCASS